MDLFWSKTSPISFELGLLDNMMPLHIFPCGFYILFKCSKTIKSFICCPWWKKIFISLLGR